MLVKKCSGRQKQTEFSDEFFAGVIRLASLSIRCTSVLAANDKGADRYA